MSERSSIGISSAELDREGEIAQSRYQNFGVLPGLGRTGQAPFDRWWPHGLLKAGSFAAGLAVEGLNSPGGLEDPINARRAGKSAIRH